MSDPAPAPSPAPTVVVAPPAAVIALPPVKPGWKTTEFYLAAGAALIGLLYASGVLSADSSSPTAKAIAFIAAALASVGYSVSRATTKSA